jgi:hypothetical protein
MSTGLDDELLSPQDRAQVASLGRVRERLVDDARSWAAQLCELSALAARAEQSGAQARRTLPLELAGSWQISQLTAERWLAEAERFADALPVALSMLSEGALLRHQAAVLLHRTAHCNAEVARAVEAQVLPDGAALCPSDLGRKVDRLRLRIESELADAAAAERAEAERIASRRTFARATHDGMALAGAVLTPEQAMGWAAGLDALERRERLADRAAGVVRTAEQRRADLFAALPALVLAGTAQDDLYRRAAGIPAGGRVGAPGPRQDELVQDDDLAGAPPWTFPADRVAASIVLNVHVPVSTVLERGREPGSLDRYGAVSAEHVRLLRPKSFRRVMVDAFTGRPLAVDDKPTPAAETEQERREQIVAMLRPGVVVDADEAQHDPSARLARLVDLRDVRCCGPGCSSSRCDRDHLVPHPHGATSARNLGLVSPRCHSAKHHGWTLVRHPDGSVTWHSPLSRRYDRPGPWEPPPRVDLHAEPPPLRPRAQVPPPQDLADELSLLDRLAPPGEAAPGPEPRGVQGHDVEDEPPF